MNILHIAAHMGGGIGSAYTGLGKCGVNQKILLLEEAIDKESLSKVEKQGFKIIKKPNDDQLKRELSQADIIVFNWSHHPALTKFLIDFPDIAIRSLLWCHVSGNYFPHLFPVFLKKFHQVLFTTPYSLILPQVKEMGGNYSNEHFGVVYGLGDLSRFTEVKRVQHKKFIVGYVGTLGFCKLHPDFVDFTAALDIADVEFALVGSPSTRREILEAAQKRGIAEKFVFYGQVDDVRCVLSRMDVFSYILNPQHFGATENALLEAMASGLPAVALNQSVESIIIKNNKTGFLVNSPEAYGEAIRQLYVDKTFANEMGIQAKEDMLQRFNIEDNRKRFISYCHRAMNFTKKIHQFNDFFGKTPSDWFLSCVETDRECFLENRVTDAGLIFKEKTKGSPAHYLSYFPDDPRLAFWVNQYAV